MPKSKIVEIYKALINRLPSTYPHAKLVIHPNIEDLSKCYGKQSGDYDENSPPYAFCDSDDNSIHISLSFKNESIQSIVWFYLHEIGHLYALQRYGPNDQRWKSVKISERYANSFADRWMNKLEKEDWFYAIDE